MTRFRKESIPWAMAAGRALLGPVLILSERSGWSGAALSWLVATALLSDIFDGVLARRWHCDTAGVRLFDSMADTVFYLCVAVTLWFHQPHILHENALLLGSVLVLEALRLVVDLGKFGKPASYHSYLAKAWGLVMAVAIMGTFAYTRASGLIPLALLAGVASNLEGLAMSLILPVWRKDVKTFTAARRIQRELAGPAMQQQQASNARAVVTASALLLTTLIASPALALDPNQALYIGGSPAIAPDTLGTLDTTQPTALIFHVKQPDGAARELAIKYSSIHTVDARNEVTHHLGVAPAIAVGLLAARQRRYFITLTWTDEAGVAQAAEIEVPRREQQPLLTIIRARMPRQCGFSQAPCSRPLATQKPR